MFQSMKGTGDKVCCTFTTYNVLATLFGLLVVAVASWLAADKISFFTELKLLDREENDSVSEEFANVSVIDYGAFILIAIGVAIVIQSLLGCIGTMMGCCGNRGARRFLIVYGVLVAIVVVCEIVAAILVLYVFVEQIGESAKTFMVSTLERDYKVPGPGEGELLNNRKLFLIKKIHHVRTELWLRHLSTCNIKQTVTFQSEHFSSK